MKPLAWKDHWSGRIIAEHCVGDRRSGLAQFAPHASEACSREREAIDTANEQLCSNDTGAQGVPCRAETPRLQSLVHPFRRRLARARRSASPPQTSKCAARPGSCSALTGVPGPQVLRSSSIGDGGVRVARVPWPHRRKPPGSGAPRAPTPPPRARLGALPSPRRAMRSWCLLRVRRTLLPPRSPSPLREPSDSGGRPRPLPARPSTPQYRGLRRGRAPAVRPKAGNRVPLAPRSPRIARRRPQRRDGSVRSALGERRRSGAGFPAATTDGKPTCIICLSVVEARLPATRSRMLG